MGKGLVSASMAFLIVVFFTSHHALSSNCLAGDTGKPEDYDLTIKRFRDLIPNFEAFVKALPYS